MHAVFQLSVCCRCSRTVSRADATAVGQCSTRTGVCTNQSTVRAPPAPRPSKPPVRHSVNSALFSSIPSGIDDLDMDQFAQDIMMMGMSLRVICFL